MNQLSGGSHTVERGRRMRHTHERGGEDAPGQGVIEEEEEEEEVSVCPRGRGVNGE